ncbi:MAG: hypothetical protein RLZZ546_663 [Bacteroidota bacterium]|jgi:putative ABC transport system ATP-binding protein
MLKTKALTFNYDKSNQFVFPDVNIDSKQSLLLIGRSGVGKTTLLHLLGGLMKPSSGEIKINEQDIAQMSERKLDKFRGENIGIVFQQNHFVDSLNVLENILLAQTIIGKVPDKKRAIELMDRLKIKEKQNKKTHTLSQGERQRVAIARATINSPKLILADEPTSAIDDQNCIEVFKLFEEQAKNENAALVIVTHDNRLKALIHNQIILE